MTPAGAWMNSIEILTLGAVTLGDPEQKENLEEFEWEKFFKRSDSGAE